MAGASGPRLDRSADRPAVWRATIRPLATWPTRDPVEALHAQRGGVDCLLGDPAELVAAVDLDVAVARHGVALGTGGRHLLLQLVDAGQPVTQRLGGLQRLELLERAVGDRPDRARLEDRAVVDARRQPGLGQVEAAVAELGLAALAVEVCRDEVGDLVVGDRVQAGDAERLQVGQQAAGGGDRVGQEVLVADEDPGQAGRRLEGPDRVELPQGEGSGRREAVSAVDRLGHLERLA